MAFGSLEAGEENEPLADINMVPFIDVMRVLLIIFIVAAPLLTHAVRIDLPKASSSPEVTQPAHVRLAIDAAGQVFWNGETVTPEQLGERMAAAAQAVPQPETHLHAERTTAYEKVAAVMPEAARRGLLRIGFVTDPGGEAVPVSGPSATDPPGPRHEPGGRRASPCRSGSLEPRCPRSNKTGWPLVLPRIQRHAAPLEGDIGLQGGHPGVGRG